MARRLRLCLRLPGRYIYIYQRPVTYVFGKISVAMIRDVESTRLPHSP